MAITTLNGFTKDTPLDKPVDAMFDRAGYYVIGKPERKPGECWFKDSPFDVNPTLFTIIHYETYQRLLDEQFEKEEVDANGIGIFAPQKKLDVVAMEKKLFSGTTANMRLSKDVITKEGTLEDKKQWEEALAADAGEHHTIYTIGAGKDHATVGAFMSAAASSDCGVCYDANFTELITFGSKQLQLYGAIADQGVTLQYSSSTYVVYMNNAHGALVQNFTIDGQSTATYGIIANGKNCIVRECVSHSSTHGFYADATSVRLIDDTASDNTNGFYQTVNTIVSIHCTSAHNTAYGFTAAAGTVVCVGDLASDNGTADFNNAVAANCCWNTSKDGTAPGAGNSINTFVNTDYVNDAGRDFHLRTAVAATTAARREGYPLDPFDIAGQERKHIISGADNYFFGGASDADPAGAVTPTFAGITGIANNADGSVTVSFTEGTDAIGYLISLDTSSISGANLTALVYLAAATDHTGTASRSVRIWNQPGTTSKLVAAGAAAVTWYGAVRAISSTGTQDSNTVNLSTSVTNTETTGPNYDATDTQGTALFLGTSATDIYVCPAGQTVEIGVRFCNTNAAARNITVYRVPSGDAEGDDVTDVSAMELGASGTATHRSDNIWFQLGPGDKVSGLTTGDATSVAVTRKVLGLIR